MNTNTALLPALVFTFGISGVAGAASILSPADIGVAFDHDVGPSASGSPLAEGVANILDSNSGSKYLNTGGAGSGFIVTPSGGPSTIQSFILTTANDAEGRDPATWQLYGTNDAIISTNNSNGLGGENWTVIGSGAAGLPAARFAAGPTTNFANLTSFTSYKMVFPTLKTDPLMQIADASFWTGSSATGVNVLTSGSTILAIDQPGFSSSYPGAGENPAKAFDGNIGTKYLNFGENNSGLIIRPASGSSIVTSLEMWTAGDAEERDPATFRIWGSNDALASIENGFGDGENWTEIATGALALPAARGASGGVVSFANSTAYTLYKFEVVTVKDAAAANSMQFAELQLYAIPEAGSATLALGAIGLLASRRRRA